MAKHVPKMTGIDLQYAVKELAAWRDGQRGSKLSWSLLEKSTGFSRQTLCSKPEIATGYAAAKLALAKGLRPRRTKDSDFLEDRVLYLKSEVARYKELESEWLERWVRIAYHARGKGLSIEELDRPLPPAGRR